MPGDDIVKAELALSELPRARRLPTRQAWDVVTHIHQTIVNDGTKSARIENAQADAWLAVGRIDQMLSVGFPVEDALWDRAIELVQQWRILLD